MWTLAPKSAEGTAPEPMQATAPAAPQVMAEPALMGSLVPPMPDMEPVADGLAPGGPTDSADQGPLKHTMTQALLWLVQIEDPNRYTFHQARVLLTRAVATAVRSLFDPFQRRATARWSQAKEDWEKSGEAVAKQKARQVKREREVDVDPRSGPLSGR